MNLSQQVLNMTTMSFIFYILAIVFIGYISYKRTSSNEDFLLAGRKLGPLTVALSAGASDMSGWLLLGLPGAFFVGGLSAIWLPLGLLIGCYINWLIVAGRLRLYSHLINSITIPGYLEKRFSDNNKLLRICCAIFILFFFMVYVASGFIAGGKLFNSAFDIEYKYAVILITIIVLLYTAFGGFLAVSWTDVLQGLLMLFALVIVPILAISKYPLDEVIQINPNVFKFFTDLNDNPITLISIIGLMAWGLGYFGQPHILARFMASKSYQDITSARRIAISWTFITLFGASLVGLIGISAFSGGLGDGEVVFIKLINLTLHPVVAGICLAAILAAIMSTADSQLLVSSSALTEDIYKSLSKNKVDPKLILLLSRIGVGIISLIAMFIAFNQKSSVLDVVGYAWAGFGAAFGPTIILSLYWARMNKEGAIAGVLSGGLSVIIVEILQQKFFKVDGIENIFDIYSIVPSMIISFICIIIFTNMFKEPNINISKSYNEFNKQL